MAFREDFYWEKHLIYLPNSIWERKSSSLTASYRVSKSLFVGTFFGHYEKSCQSTSCLKNSTCLNLFTEEYGQYYGQMNTMNPHTMRTMKQQHEGKKIKKSKEFKIFSL